jgi:hypothetical protein
VASHEAGALFKDGLSGCVICHWGFFRHLPFVIPGLAAVGELPEPLRAFQPGLHKDLNFFMFTCRRMLHPFTLLHQLL